MLWARGDGGKFAGSVNCVPHAQVVTTTIHKTIGGGRGGMILCTEELAKKIDSAVFPGQQGGPLEHVIAGKAVALRIAASEPFRERQERTLAGAKSVASELLSAGGGVSAGAHGEVGTIWRRKNEMFFATGGGAGEKRLGTGAQAVAFAPKFAGSVTPHVDAASLIFCTFSGVSGRIGRVMPWPAMH